MNQKPRLRTPIFFFIVAGLLWIASGYGETRAVTSVLYVLTFAAAGGLVYSGVDYLAYTIARRARDFREASVAGETARLGMLISWNNSVAGLDSDHLAYAAKIRPTIKIISGHHTPPLYMLMLENGVEVIWPFVVEFCQASSGKFLAERRRWSEGSAAHRWADALTIFFIRNGYAVDAQGNQAARWISQQAKEEAFYSIGFELEVV